MITRADVHIAIVTKGDRDISKVMNSVCGFGRIDVFNNKLSNYGDQIVYGRYWAMIGLGTSIISNGTLPKIVATQDDDVIVDWDALLANYEPGKLVCNVPQPWRSKYADTGISLVGFGAVMDRDLVATFPPQKGQGFGDYFDAGFPLDEIFRRECDRVFTYLNRDRTVWVDVGIERLDYGAGKDRMGYLPRVRHDYQVIRERLSKIK